MKDPFSIRQDNDGVLSTAPKIYIDNENISLVYTPGVGEVSKAFSENKDLAKKYSFKKNSVAVISDGTAVLGLGDIGPYGALPVMEGKSILFKQLADIDAVPICLDEKDPDKIIETIVNIAPSFGGINLEDIKAPKCFYIEEKLKQLLDIPVVHDDQHGTAVVVLAGLYNALFVAGLTLEHAKIIINGSGAAGISVAKILYDAGARNIIVCDSLGVLSKDRDLSPEKNELLSFTNKNNISGTLKDALVDAHVFIGLSKGGVLTKEMVVTMARNPIIFALANPTPEIFPDEAKEAGAIVVATGRSDFQNQINNVLSFPGIFRGALDNTIINITQDHFIRSARVLADLVQNPTKDKILPSIFDERVVKAIAAVFAEK